MTSPRPNPIVRLMPSLTDVAFLMPLVFLFARMDGMHTLLSDGDTGWHIRTGEWILANGRVPHQDIFSFTMVGKPWFAWEWLWDIGAASIFGRWGMGGVQLASLFVICLTFALLFRLANRRSGNPIIAIALTLVAAAGASIHWLARPHLFTMLFTVVFLTILQRVREGRTRLLWSLPAITILWTNLHGGFLAGILILFAYLGGELARAALANTSDERRAAARASLPYLATLAGCCAATLVNPYFYHLHVHIWQYLRDPYEMSSIVEFQSANFQNVTAIFLEDMLVLGVAAAIWEGLRKRFADVFLIVGWAHLALVSGRNIPLYMIVAAPIAASASAEWLKLITKARVAVWVRRDGAELADAAATEIGPIDRMWRSHAVCALAMIILALGMASPVPVRMLKPGYDAKIYPSAALAYLNPSQRIFTHDLWGDYLIYRLAPQGTKVFIDGRSDFYGGKFCQEYVDLMSVKYDWEQTLSRYAIDTILLPPTAPLASTLKESRNWRVVYDDGSAIVFQAAQRSGAGRQRPTSITGGGQRDLSITQTKTAILNRGNHKTIGAKPI